MKPRIHLKQFLHRCYISTVLLHGLRTVIQLFISIKFDLKIVLN